MELDSTTIAKQIERVLKRGDLEDGVRKICEKFIFNNDFVDVEAIQVPVRADFEEKVSHWRKNCKLISNIFIWLLFLLSFSQKKIYSLCFLKF